MTLAVLAAVLVTPVARLPLAAAWTLWSASMTPAAAGVGSVDHLVVSEVMTGGASASDEFIELYNPTGAGLPLEGLEIVYVSASGATVTRKAAWVAGEPVLASGGHLLVANEAGVFATIADLTYANGLAATGGSLALRIIGAPAAIDAVGWGTAASDWLEGLPAPAVAAGHSLERLPGGVAGSGQDTDANAVDFVDIAVPDPQNRSAPLIPIDPSPSPTPTPSVGPTVSASPTQTPIVSHSPTPTPTPTLQQTPTLTATPTATPPATATPLPTSIPAITVAAARALPDGSIATIEAVSLTDGAFGDGGGCVTDGTAGIAVLVTGGSFPRGSQLAISGEVDDRYHQRTLRAQAADVLVLRPAAEPAPIEIATGSVGEAAECLLVAASGSIASSATQLSGAVAYDLDDGSGPARLVVPDASAVDTSAWMLGTSLSLRGVVIQRDSSGGGTSGYRLTLRDTADVLAVQPPSSPTPSASGSPEASPGPSDDPSVVSIEAARAAVPNTRIRVRGVVTLPTSVLGDGTAAIQDASGAIILRLGDEAGALSIGDLVQVDGTRSTKSGMETLRVSTPPQRLGSPAVPGPARHATGALGEAQEARLVVVRGTVIGTPRRTSAQNVYLDLDDGSGPLRVYLTPGSGIEASALAAGDWVEIVGVLGQETSGQQPLRGYRLWPRRPGDVRIVSPAAGAPDAHGGGAPTQPGAGIEAGTGSGHGAGTAGGSSSRPGAGWPVGIPVPRLVPASLDEPPATARPTTTPAPRVTAAATQPGGASGLILLVVAAGILGAAAAVAAARPGLGDRLRDAFVRLTGPGGPASETDGASLGVGQAGSPMEGAVARLVPLRVLDEPPTADAAPSVDSRSAVRRILPPT